MLQELLGLAVLLGAGLLLLCVVATVWAILWITRPPRRTFASAIASGRPPDPSRLSPGKAGPRTFSTWSVQGCPVWDMPGDDPHGPLLILTHGWGDSRIGALTRAEHLLPFASRVVMWDMPGHGEAPGSITLGVREPALLRDLIDRIDDQRTPIVLMGWSLGAGVSLAAAAEAPTPRLALVIAEAPYARAITPALRVARELGGPGDFFIRAALALLGVRWGVGPAWKGFDRSELARRVRVPVLILQGTEDRVSPAQEARAIARACPQATLVEVANAGHFGLWTDPAHLPTSVGAVSSALASIAPR